MLIGLFADWNVRGPITHLLIDGTLIRHMRWVIGNLLPWIS